MRYRLPVDCDDRFADFNLVRRTACLANVLSSPSISAKFAFDVEVTGNVEDVIIRHDVSPLTKSRVDGSTTRDAFANVGLSVQVNKIMKKKITSSNSKKAEQETQTSVQVADSQTRRTVMKI
jgi:hypothetical protein